jgi:hypothetical protein
MVLGTTTPAGAQQASSSTAQVNNPLANMTALNFQDYYIGELTETVESANRFWVRFATPFSLGDANWLLRASLTLNSYPTAPNGHTKTGLGDSNVFAAYPIDTGNPAISLGIGPQLTAPSATDDALGSGKWSAGLANVLFNASFAGDDDRADVNVAALQPFLFYQLGGGTYLRSAPIWVYNIENDDYSVSLGLGLGKVIRHGKKVFNIFAEPQFSVAEEGAGQPDWQVFLGVNMQFME